jgi:hypothetical protein
MQSPKRYSTLISSTLVNNLKVASDYSTSRPGKTLLAGGGGTTTPLGTFITRRIPQKRSFSVSLPIDHSYASYEQVTGFRKSSPSYPFLNYPDFYRGRNATIVNFLNAEEIDNENKNPNRNKYFKLKRLSSHIVNDSDNSELYSE